MLRHQCNDAEFVAHHVDAAGEILFGDEPPVSLRLDRTSLEVVEVRRVAYTMRGWSLVGAIDSGTDTTHPLIRSVSGSSYQGGNFLPAYSYDFAPGREGSNVEERQPVRVPPGTPAGCVTTASSPTCLNDPDTASIAW